MIMIRELFLIKDMLSDSSVPKILLFQIHEQQTQNFLYVCEDSSVEIVLWLKFFAQTNNDLHKDTHASQN